VPEVELPRFKDRNTWILPVDSIDTWRVSRLEWCPTLYAIFKTRIREHAYWNVEDRD